MKDSCTYSKYQHHLSQGKLRKSAISKPVTLLAAEMLEMRNTYFEKMCCGIVRVMRSSSGERVGAGLKSRIPLSSKVFSNKNKPFVFITSLFIFITTFQVFCSPQNNIQ